jgi:hypothetical protein
VTEVVREECCVHYDRSDVRFNSDNVSIYTAFIGEVKKVIKPRLHASNVLHIAEGMCREHLVSRVL